MTSIFSNSVPRKQPADRRTPPRAAARSCRGRSGSSEFLQRFHQVLERGSAAQRRDAGRRGDGRRHQRQDPPGTASGAKKTPSGNWSATPAATSSASRVLPVPPDRSASGVASRPAGASAPGAGRGGRRSSSAGSAGCSGSRRACAAAGSRCRSPSMTSWASRSARERSFRRCSPRSRRLTPAGSEPSASDLVADAERAPGRRGPPHRSCAARWTSMPT